MNKTLNKIFKLVSKIYSKQKLYVGIFSWINISKFGGFVSKIQRKCLNPMLYPTLRMNSVTDLNI